MSHILDHQMVFLLYPSVLFRTRFLVFLLFGQAENFQNLQVPVSFCLTIPSSNHLFPFMFYCEHSGWTKLYFNTLHRNFLS
jgi:hypothetical protein